MPPRSRARCWAVQKVARLQSLLRRARPAPTAVASPAPEAGQPLRFDGLLIDPVRREVLRQGQAVELTSTEFDLL